MLPNGYPAGYALGSQRQSNRPRSRGSVTVADTRGMRKLKSLREVAFSLVLGFEYRFFKISGFG